MAMDYGCNVRSRNTKLQVRQSGIVVSHRIELSHIFPDLRSSDERRQAVVTPHADRHDLGLRFSQCIRSKRRLLRSMWHTDPSSADAMLSRPASAVKSNQPRLA